MNSEREKYIKIWALPAYREQSPGERLLPHFLAHYRPPASVIDLGCGTGRASAGLKKAGFDVVMLDITSRCLDEVLPYMPFLEACLWERLPFKRSFDYFYCTDVLEHIPPEHVDAVLDNAKEIAREGFFQIALFEEHFGSLIGENLHLTVKSWEWWADMICSRWDKADFVEVEKDRLCAFVA